MSATLEKIQISWGDEIARVEFRPAWKGISCPWRHLARLQPGQSWLDLPEPDITKQSQVYVTRELAAPIPPEAVAAIELAEAGATEAFVVENWLGLGVMNHELIGARRDHRIWELIEAYKSESGKKRGELSGRRRLLAESDGFDMRGQSQRQGRPQSEPDRGNPSSEIDPGLTA